MYLDFGRKLRKLWNMRVTVILVVIGKLERSLKLGKRIRRVGNQRTNRDHLNYRIFEIGQNTEMSPGDLRRLTVTQTLLEDYQLTLR